MDCFLCAIFRLADGFSISLNLILCTLTPVPLTQCVGVFDAKVHYM